MRRLPGLKNDGFPQIPILSALRQMRRKTRHRQLRARGAWPYARCRRAAERGNELAAFDFCAHSMTSSAFIVIASDPSTPRLRRTWCVPTEARRA
jgi:hypothetical protein